MGVRLLLLNVIYQTVITASLGGVILPFSDSVGKVTPIKPKPLPTTTVPLSISSSSSPVCDSKDQLKWFPLPAKGPLSQKFSSPIAITSSSRALPVPKINSTSIENVKIPKNLRAKFVSQSKSPVTITKPNICPPEASLPNKYPFSSSPYSSFEIHKLSPIPNVSSFPDIPVKSTKTSGIDLLSSSPKASQFPPLGGVTLPFSDTIGKVTPIKPRPLPTSTIPSSITSSSSPVCNGKDNHKLFSPTAKGPISQKFSSPLVFTSSSKALPVPKIDSTSIENVIIPKNLRENFLAPNKSSVRSTKPDICPPKVSLPNKCPFLLSPSKLPDDLRTYSPLGIQKWSPLPSITSLSDLAVESSETSDINLLSSSYKNSQVSPQVGVTLPFSGSIGKVTPIKPKPLPISTVRSSISSFPPAAKEPISREFSSPIAITSSSRALPVPKIDLPSIENVNLSETLREKFLALNEAPVRNAKSEASKFPFLLPPSNPLEINTLSPLPSIKSLHDVPVESVKSSSINLLSSSFKFGQFSAPVSVTLLPRSGIREPPSTLEAKNSTFSEYLTKTTISPLSPSCLSPLHYKSRYLPGVKTPSESLSYRPFYYKGAGNVDLSSHSCPHNILSQPTLSSGNNSNLLSHINEPYVLSYLDSIKTIQDPKPINLIQLPKLPTYIPISSHTVTLVQDAITKNLSPPKDVNAVSANVIFESNLEPKPASFSISSRNDQNLQDDRNSDFKLKFCSPTSPSNYFNSPLMPITISSPNVLTNKMHNIDSSKSITPEFLPGIYTETLEKNYPNDIGNYQTNFDFNNVPSLEMINLPPKSLKYSPPKIPNESPPIIFSGTSCLSSPAYCPDAITQTPTTPVSYINPTSSIGKTTSNLVSSITNLLSNITQNILSPYKPHSILQNNPQTPTYTIQSNPYTNTLLKPEQLSPVLTIPHCSPVNSISILPVLRTSDPSTTKSLNPPLAFKVSPSPPLFISSPQLTAPVSSPTSLITYSSPPFCPSYLPSPILPSYPAIESPFHMEAPVYQASSSKKDSDVENLIDLMLLTEILNNDESFDGDDLDALLAFL